MRQVQVSLLPAMPPPSRGQQPQPPPLSRPSVVVGSVLLSPAVCNHCPWSLHDKFGPLRSEFAEPVGVSLEHISTLDTSAERLYVLLPASMSPTVTDLVPLRTPQKEWDDDKRWVPRKCTHQTVAMELGHPSNSSSWAHFPNCLGDGNLGVVVVWLLDLEKDWPEHCAVKYSTCKPHCPGHVLRLDALDSSWHSFQDLVRH